MLGIKLAHVQGAVTPLLLVVPESAGRRKTPTGVSLAPWASFTRPPHWRMPTLAPGPQQGQGAQCTGPVVGSAQGLPAFLPAHCQAPRLSACACVSWACVLLLPGEAAVRGHQEKGQQLPRGPGQPFCISRGAMTMWSAAHGSLLPQYPPKAQCAHGPSGGLLKLGQRDPLPSVQGARRPASLLACSLSSMREWGYLRATSIPPASPLPFPCWSSGPTTSVYTTCPGAGSSASSFDPLTRLFISNLRLFIFARDS